MKKILSTFLLGATIFSVGCEKEKVFYETELSGAQQGLGFGLPNSEPLAITVDATTASLNEAINLFVSNGGSANATLTLDETLVASYNVANSSNFAIMPSDVYTLPTSVTVTGGAGTSDAVFDIQKLLTYGTQFALGVKISAVSGGSNYIIPGNSELVIIVKVKNKWEGNYAIKGYFFHPTVSSCRAIARDKFVSTVDPNTSEAELGDLGGSNYRFRFDVAADGVVVNNWLNVGATPAVPASGFMTLDNPYGIVGYPGATTGFVSTTYNNTYDDATGVFLFHYGYGTGSSSQTGYGRQVYEKWTLK